MLAGGVLERSSSSSSSSSSPSEVLAECLVGTFAADVTQPVVVTAAEALDCLIECGGRTWGEGFTKEPGEGDEGGGVTAPP